MTFSIHVWTHMQSKDTPSRSKWVQVDSPSFHLTMNIQLDDKRGFDLQVMVDVIHCHHSGLVNNTNITVQPGYLYVPDLQLPPCCRPKQQVIKTVWTTQIHLQKKDNTKENCKIILSTEWNWGRAIQSGLTGPQRICRGSVIQARKENYKCKDAASEPFDPSIHF